MCRQYPRQCYHPRRQPQQYPRHRFHQLRILSLPDPQIAFHRHPMQQCCRHYMHHPDTRTHRHLMPPLTPEQHHQHRQSRHRQSHCYYPTRHRQRRPHHTESHQHHRLLRFELMLMCHQHRLSL